MKIGVATYSLTKLVRKGEMTLLDVVDWLAENGLEGIEINGLESYTDGSVKKLARSLSARIRKHGLTPTSYTLGANLLQLDDQERAGEIERLKKAVDLAADLGCTRLRHDVARGFPEGYRGRKTWDEALKYIAPACREVAEHAVQYGIVTSMENHGFFAQASERVKKLVETVDHTNFGITVDMGNFLCVDEEPLPAVRRLAKYASHVHLKDFHRKTRREDPGEGWFRTAGKNYLRGAIVGHGEVPVRQCMAALARAGYDGWYSLEFEGMEDPRVGVRVGADNARRYLASIEGAPL